ncbi:MAG: Rrf2 family transcriptional regulator [Betaproteobacteria bacterium]|nr:Rrf2 family transcriptional regulator [Betaproteobacteria bacterium]
MRLTTKGRFAVTAMLDLAIYGVKDGEVRPVKLSSISDRQSISLSYLEQLFGKLRRNQLVESVRGPGGGYNLGRPAEQLTVADIIIAVEESIDARQCEGRENCAGERRCLTHDLWETLNDAIIKHLSGVTLSQLVVKHHAKMAQAGTHASPERKRISIPVTAV